MRVYLEPHSTDCLLLTPLKLLGNSCSCRKSANVNKSLLIVSLPFPVRVLVAVSVGVSCGTLVAISLERFYAICQPLKSRRWQTLAHSYRVIQAIWLTSVSVMIPIAVFNRVIKLKNGKQACR
ncbi:cholecystokinin receptor [Elysia marginata]|uniref:Cholecystokinin receptor n=1 Tax=Elysia marginata TaxID=1093978 RepID=A0AAV4F6X3_9GAST|nr:cholecystokinin receptor [Elysia marginata]